MAQPGPLINGRAYDWSQVVVRMSNGTLPFFGITAVNYEDDQEIENNYGAGVFAVSRGFGNYTCTASITITMEEVVKIQQALPSRRLQEVPEFDVVVSYVHPTTAKIVNDTIRNVRFKNNKRALAQNDKQFAVELELVPSHIEWDGAQVIGLGTL